MLQQSDLDVAVTRVAKHAIMLGLLDDEVTYRNVSLYGPQVVDSPAHRQLALEAATQAITLLKNDHAILPLSPSTRVALLGPHFNATQDMISIYHGTVELVSSHSPLMALQNLGVPIVGYAPGCAGTDGVDPSGDTGCLDVSGFPAAVALAKQADVAIVFVGNQASHVYLRMSAADIYASSIRLLKHS